MFNKEQKTIELSEKKFSLEYLVQLYMDERLHFPQMPRKSRLYKEIVADLIKAIYRGIPMPVMYVSELQNGDFLVLEAEDRLMYLLKYIQGDFCIDIDEVQQKSGRYYFYELEGIYPRYAGMILRTTFRFQIIDYRTPKYLHLEVGLFHEKWSVDREQTIRDELYSGQEIEMLQYFSDKAYYIMCGFWGIRNPLQNEYAMLYMMLFWGIYKDILSVNNDMGEQELLDVILSELFEMRHMWLDFLEVLDSCTLYLNQISMHGFYNSFLHDAKYSGKTIGLIACYYDMCQYAHANIDEIFYDLIENKSFMKKVKAMRITVENIDTFLNIGKDQIR